MRGGMNGASPAFMSRSILFLAVGLLSACAATTPREPVSVSRTTAAQVSTSADVTTPIEKTDDSTSSSESCALVCGGAAASREEVTMLDYHDADVANADAVFASMHDDLLACYKARVDEHPNAHAFLVIDVLVAPDGSVRNVDTSGGALLGEKTMRCITDRVGRAMFDPVRGGGTLHVQVPLAFTRSNTF